MTSSGNVDTDQRYDGHTALPPPNGDFYDVLGALPEADQRIVRRVRAFGEA